MQSIKSYFKDLFQEQQKKTTSWTKKIELATAVLMIEISLADDHVNDNEYHLIHHLLHKNFGINHEEISKLIETAEKEVDHAVSLYEFTRVLNDNLSVREKINIVENLWRVAYADSILDKYEEYYIRKIADLLYVPHSNYIQAKHRAAKN